MTTALHDARTQRRPTPTSEPAWARVARGLGWVLIAGGVVVGLFIVYLLWWTDLETADAQADLVGGFNQFVIPDAPAATSPQVRDLANIPVETEPLPVGDDPLITPTDPGDAYALIWFQRDDEFVVTDGPVGMVEGVTLDHLRQGPGHYPFAVAPGQPGNSSFAGHRTTYGRPFHNVELLEAGDEIHVLDNAGRHWVYDYLETRIVLPTDTWVVEDGAVPDVSHLLTLTSCHPKFSARERIVIHGELRNTPAPSPDQAGSGDPAGADRASELPGEDG